MSTRICSGSRYPGYLRPDIMARQLAARTTPVHEQLVIEAVAKLLHASIRDQLAGNPGAAESVVAEQFGPAVPGGTFDFLMCADQVIQTASASSQRPSADLSLEFSVVFISDPEGRRWCYASPFATNPRLAAVWQSMPEVEPYPYWSNTDRPAEISDEDWDKRGAVWARLLGDQPWSTAGVTWAAEIPSAVSLFVRDENTFRAAVTRHLLRLEYQRDPEFALRREPTAALAAARTHAENRAAVNAVGTTDPADEVDMDVELAIATLLSEANEGIRSL